MRYLLFIFDVKTSEVFGSLVFESSIKPEPISQFGSYTVFGVNDYAKIEGNLEPSTCEGILFVLNLRKYVPESGNSSIRGICISVGLFDPSKEDVQERIQKEIQKVQQKRERGEMMAWEFAQSLCDYLLR